MSYGTIKVDTITFTDGGVDKSISVSGLTQNPTITGNLTVTGTLSGTTITGTEVLATTGVFNSITGSTIAITTASGVTPALVCSGVVSGDASGFIIQGPLVILP